MLAETRLGGGAAGTDQVDVTLYGQAHMEQMITGIRSIEEGIALPIHRRSRSLCYKKCYKEKHR